jgi:hypothetical protein
VPASGGTFIGVTSESGSGNLAGSCASTDEADEAVFSWTPTASGSATIQTCSGIDTDFDTALYLRSGSCFVGPEVACSNDGNGCQTSAKGKPRGSRLKLDVLAGETYFVVVDGVNGAGGQFSLTIDAPAGTDTGDGNATATPDTTAPAIADARLALDAATTGDQATATESAPPAYRCHRISAAEATAETTPTEAAPLHLVDRFGELVADVRKARTLCAPVVVAEGDPATAVTTIERWDLLIDDYTVRTPRAYRLRTMLGDVELELVRPDAVQVPVTVEPPLTAAAADVLDVKPDDADTCYKVRGLGDAANRQWVPLALGGESERYDVVGPTRLCVGAHQGDAADSTRVQLCYRARTTGTPAGADDTDAAAPTVVTVTSIFATAEREIGAVSEVCLPAELVGSVGP